MFLLVCIEYGFACLGGDLSNYAMASIVRHHGFSHIVGLDHTPSADSEEINSMVYQHLRKLRSRPEFQHCLFVVFIEANMSFVETDRINRLVCVFFGG